MAMGLLAVNPGRMRWRRWRSFIGGGATVNLGLSTVAACRERQSCYAFGHG
jgi:hypothetical protein